MAVFLVPIGAAVVGGLLVIGAGIGLNESRKSKAADAAEKKAAEIGAYEKAELKGQELWARAKKHEEKGALYPAFREYRKFLDHMGSHFNISPEEKKKGEDTYDGMRKVALEQYRTLLSNYEKAVAPLYESGDEPYQVQKEFVDKLITLLGPDAPKVKEWENKFGASYKAYKYPINN
jgi:hypothetical protein